MRSIIIIIIIPYMLVIYIFNKKYVFNTVQHTFSMVENSCNYTWNDFRSGR